MIPEECNASSTLSELISSGNAIPVSSGYSNARVYRIARPDGDLFVKVRARDGFDVLARERDVLIWLKGKALVAEVVAFRQSGDDECLVTSAVAGHDCVAVNELRLQAPEQIVEALAAGLLHVHSIPVGDCPFDQTVAEKLARARKYIALGLIDDADIDAEWRGMTVPGIYRYLVENNRYETDLVFTHGDYCLPNVLLSAGEISGFIDLATAGVADRYNDLAIASRSIRHNLGHEFEELFFECYGLREVNLEAIRYYRALDELAVY